MFEKMKEQARWFFKIFELDQWFFDSDCFKEAQPEPMVVWFWNIWKNQNLQFFENPNNHATLVLTFQWGSLKSPISFERRDSPSIHPSFMVC